MNNKYLATLIPTKNIENIDIESLSADYYYYKINKGSKKVLINILSWNEKINTIIEEKDGKYYLNDTDIEIIIDNNESINYGYIVTTKTPLEELEKYEISKSKSTSEAKEILFETLKNKRKFDTSMSRCISNILIKRSALIEYMKKMLENKEVFFKWVYVYDKEKKDYNKFIMPLKKNKVKDEKFSTHISDYTDIIFNYGYNSKANSDGSIYVDKKTVIPNEDDFELLQSLNKLMFKKEYVRGVFKEVFDKKKAEMINSFYEGEKKNGNNFSK